jgi:single-strand DNA-binding protein
VNSCIFIGNLTADPEMRYTESGKAVTSFSIAINNGRTPDGEDRPPTFLDIVAWDRLAETTAEFLRKGKKVAVQGAVTVDKWTDNEGVKRQKYRIRANNVEFLSPRDDNDEHAARPQQQQTRRAAPRDDLDDLPF